MTQSAIPGQGTTRRVVVTAAGAAGLAATLAACGKDDDGGSGGGSADSAQDAGGSQPSQGASQSAEAVHLGLVTRRDVQPVRDTQERLGGHVLLDRYDPHARRPPSTDSATPVM